MTLVHLGAYTVHSDDAVPEGAVVGHAGETTGGEWQRAYVHLGVRRTSDPHGYLDPLTLLPPRGGAATQPLPEPPAVEAPVPRLCRRRWLHPPSRCRPEPARRRGSCACAGGGSGRAGAVAPAARGSGS